MIFWVVFLVVLVIHDLVMIVLNLKQAQFIKELLEIAAPMVKKRKETSLLEKINKNFRKIRKIKQSKEEKPEPLVADKEKLTW